MADKWSILVLKLIEATRENKITWTVADPTFTTEGIMKNIAGLIYTTNFMDQLLRVYKKSSSITFGRGGERGVEPDISLEFINSEGIVLYEAPKIQGLTDLYQAIQYQTVNLDKFFEKLGK
jgi:hypothetical protein